MGDIQPFSIAKIQYEFTESEALDLKVKLLALRKKHIQRMHTAAMHDLKDIESEIADIEYKLAHASITPDLETSEPSITTAIADEFRAVMSWIHKKANEGWHTQRHA